MKEKGGRPLGSGKAVGRAEYEAGWAAYREKPGLTTVQEAVGCGADVARRLVHQGLPKLALPGYEKRLMDENRAAVAGEKRLAVSGEKLSTKTAARLVEEQKAAAERTVKAQVEILGDAEKQRAEELRLVRANRIGALALAGITGKLLRSADKLGTYYEQRLQEVERQGLTGGAALKALGMKPKEVLLHMRAIGNVMGKVAEISEASVKMERLLMGEPTAIIGNAGEVERPKTKEEALERFNKSAKAFERFRQRQAAVEAVVEEEGEADA